MGSDARATLTESVPTDLLAVIASHAADAEDVASLASADKVVREATAAEVEERRLKLEQEKAALKARLTSELLIEQPYHMGDMWIEQIVRVEVRRLKEGEAVPKKAQQPKMTQKAKKAQQWLKKAQQPLQWHGSATQYFDDLAEMEPCGAG